MLHQEVDAMFLRRDRIRIRFRHFLEHRMLVTSSSKPPGARLSARTLPSTITLDSCVSPLNSVEHFRRHRVFGHHTLHESAAVAE